MSNIQLEIEGLGAVSATEELLTIDGIEGEWEPANEGVQRDVSLATIATIVAITTGSITIAEKLYAWFQKRRRPDTAGTIDRVILIGRNGDRILLKDASVEQIKRILES